MSPILITYPTWREIYGQRPTDAAFLAEIQPLDRLNSFWLLARINLLLALDRVHRNDKKTADLQSYLINFLFSDDLFGKMRERYGSERLVERQPFHSAQVLTVMKRVAVESARVGGLRPDMQRDAAYRLGRALTMANDFLFSEQNARAIRHDRPSWKRAIALQLQTGSGLEINNPPPIDKSIVRSDAIFLRNPEKDHLTFDIRADFERRTKITLEDYISHVFGLLAHYLTLDTAKIIEDSGLACIRFPTFFAEAPKDSVESFWLTELATIDEIERSLLQPRELATHHDFIAFRRRPFVQVAEETAVPIHLGFVQEKLESGLFWAIFNALGTREERGRLFTEWGHLYQDYISGLLSESLTGSQERYLPFPTFSDNGEEAFDGIVVSGKYWVVMEYKGGFLNAAAKYADNEDEFVRDVDLKFGTGKGAGIEQLVRKIASVFAKKPDQRRALRGADSSHVEVVLPMLIVQEGFVSSEMTAHYLAYLFGKLKRKHELARNIVCTFPIILDVSELESLKPYLQQGRVSLVECLMARVRMGESRFLSFRDFLHQHLAEKGIARVKDPEMIARFRSLMDRISRRLFNRPFEPSTRLESPTPQNPRS